MLKLWFIRHIQIRLYTGKSNVKLDDTVEALLNTGTLKHRKHPGIVKPNIVKFPNWLLQSIKIVLTDNQLEKTAVKDTAMKLVNHLHGRHPPNEDEEFNLKNKRNNRKSRENIMDAMKHMNENENGNENENENESSKQIKNTERKSAYVWAPIFYDKLTSISYMVGRSAQDYAVIYKILSEIYNNDRNFKPQSMFDFGSGIGTAMWVVSDLWSSSMKEYVCVDTSAEINDLSEELARNAKPKIKTTFYRQFLPVSSDKTYDIVISAYSLLELPSAKFRLETMLNLWKKTEHYLVIVEQGTNACFNVLDEIRDFILHYSKNCEEAVHIFSPCPHELKCPRYTTCHTPCNFEVMYYSLPLIHPSEIHRERYSYIVFKKGKRAENDLWPRIVRPVLRRSRHVICRMCVPSGQLKEEFFTKWKNGRNTYRCARCSEWGDRVPIKLEE